MNDSVLFIKGKKYYFQDKTFYFILLKGEDGEIYSFKSSERILDATESQIDDIYRSMFNSNNIFSEVDKYLDSLNAHFDFDYYFTIDLERYRENVIGGLIDG